MSDLNDLSDLEGLDLPFDVHKVRPMCIACIRKHVEKYKNHVDEKDRPLDNRFIVPCQGALKYPVDPRLKNTFSVTEWEEIQAIFDPVLWAKKYVVHPSEEPWIARFYQEEVMRCTSTRRALRISRRCLVAGTPVLMADGTWRPIEEVKEGEYIVSRKATGHQPVKKKVIYEHDNGEREVFKITFSDGRSIICTSNHPLLVNKTNRDGRGMHRVWKDIDSGLSTGDKVVVLKQYDVWGKKNNPDLGALLGYMLTDGYFGATGQTPKFTNNNIKMIEEVKNLSLRLFNYKCSVRTKGNGYDIHITDCNKKTENKFVVLLKELGLSDIKSRRKYIPDALYLYNKQTLMVMINRMFSGDGSVSVVQKTSKKASGEQVHYSRPELVLVSSSFEILEQIRLMLLKLNITGSLRKEERVTNKSNGKLSVLYRLVITDSSSVENFFFEVGLIYGKEEQSKKALDCARFAKKRRKQGTKNYRTVTIRSIELLGKRHTYDIEVEHTHNFITNGIVSHNTGKTDVVSVEICYHMFTKKNERILVTAPQKVHVEEIIDRIRGFIGRNANLHNEVVRDVSSPYYEIQLANGSRVRGFPLGTRGKSEGVAVRGQNADKIYCDEMDFADDKAIVGGLFPILQTTPETAMTGFSTPTGFKSTYYAICEDNPYYKEFHYNYRVLPHWRMVEKDRPQYTEDEWVHEMLAEWGSAESGVYKPSYVDRSLRAYLYDEQQPSTGWRYVMGVDWNEKHGAELVVVGENVNGGYYQIVEALAVEKSEFTQLKSVQALIALHRKWSPVKIYVDAGNGSTNYELIRKISYEQRRPGGDKQVAKLLDIVKKYDAGSSIEVHDPITNEKRKTPAKPYMVNAAVRVFEQDKMRISSADKILEPQLRNYIIERISPTGTPVYGMRDKKVPDHRLDAFNLAMVAYFKEFGGLQRTNVITTALSAVNPVSKLGGAPRKEAKPGGPEERRIDSDSDRSVIMRGAYLPARVDMGKNIPTNKPGWEYDLEDHYERLNQHRRNRRNRNVRGRGAPIRRTNI